MRAYLDFWRRCFSFRGRTTRHDYRVSVLLFAVLGFVIELAEAIVLVLVFDLAAKGIVSTAYGYLGTIALISMSVRRVRDSGHAGKESWFFLIPILGQMRLFWCLFFEKSPSERNNIQA